MVQLLFRALRLAPSALIRPATFLPLPLALQTRRLLSTAESAEPLPPPPQEAVQRPQRGSYPLKKPRGFSKDHARYPPATKTAEQFAEEKHPYFVRRTASQRLAIYRQVRNTLVVTTVKHVDGNRLKLLEELVELLGIDRTRTRINPWNLVIELKV